MTGCQYLKCRRVRQTDMAKVMLHTPPTAKKKVQYVYVYVCAYACLLFVAVNLHFAQLDPLYYIYI
jgi:hypothetical protein